MQSIIRDLEALPERHLRIMELKNQIVTETKLEINKEQKEQAIKEGKFKIDLKPGEFLSSNGSVIKPEKKLDKQAYQDIVLE